MKPDLSHLLSARAQQEGTTKAAITERALRVELDAPASGLIHQHISPRQAKLLHDTSANLGYEPAPVLEALISTYLPRLTADDVDPERRRKLAAEKARAYLGAA